MPVLPPPHLRPRRLLPGASCKALVVSRPSVLAYVTYIAPLAVQTYSLGLSLLHDLLSDAVPPTKDDRSGI